MKRRILFVGLFLAALPTLAFANPPSGFTTVKTVPAPETQAGKVTYRPETKLNGSAAATGGQAQEITMDVPKSVQGMRLAHIEIEHSQNLAEKTEPWSGKKGDRDNTAPYSQVEVFVEGKGWTNLGQAKKFAEARPEVERLHDLPDPKGNISQIRVRNVGVDPVRLHDVTLHFLPAKPKAFDEAVLMPGASFGDAWSEVAPRTARVRDVVVPGTRYPGAIVLNNNGKWSATEKGTVDKMAAKGWVVERDSLVIPLQAGKRLRIAEVAIGDTQPDPEKNGDGSYGRKGYAKLNLVIERANGSRVVLTSSENIPAEGVMVGTTDHTVQPGDRLRVQATADAAALMGVRLGYDD